LLASGNIQPSDYNSPMRILVIEDEHRIAEALKKGLEQERYAVDLAYTGSDGYELAASEDYDLIVMDLMLPEMDGNTICAKLRKENIHTPIIMLTAKSQVGDKVAGLDSGADDYLTKPFAFEELLSRIRALLRRPKGETSNELQQGPIVMNLTTFAVTLSGNPIVLSSKEYSLLEYLLRHKNMIISKDQIIAHVWDYESNILPNTVEVYIKKLRAKGIIIETVRGFGYRLGTDHV
jgi:DNA-binding response OmpR family regulator